MTDVLHDLLTPHLSPAVATSAAESSDLASKYLSRLISLRLSDLTTTEPESLSQSAHSNLVSLQQLSSRSHRTTSASATHLATLRASLPLLTSSTTALRQQIPPLDAAALTFAQAYSKSNEASNPTLADRRTSALLAAQADKLTDILELPSLLSATIASASQPSSTSANANYSQALDLFAHIRRLAILHPDSALIASVVRDAESAMRDMTTALIASLRAQNIRLAAAIRTIGWLRRVAPELSFSSTATSTAAKPGGVGVVPPVLPVTQQGEEYFGALFLVARLATFVSMTEALAPLRELADQETQARQSSGAPAPDSSVAPTSTSSRRAPTASQPAPSGAQTERYLKRYIEIFREQSFAAISNYLNIFPPTEPDTAHATDDPLALPSALASYPHHLVDLLEETLRTYLPNVSDPSARESLLMQVLYAAGSLGRLGADFSLVIAGICDVGPSDVAGAGAGADTEGEKEKEHENGDGEDAGQQEESKEPEETRVPEEPEWVAIIKKHRVQAARLEALAAGQEREVTVR